MLEKEIERAVCEYFEACGLFFWKQPSIGLFDVTRKAFRKLPKYGIRGVPDIIIIENGLFFGVEIKTRTGRQSEHQKAFESRLRLKNGHYFICRSLEDAGNIVKAIKMVT